MAHSLSPCWYMLVHAIALSRLHSLSFTRASFPRLSLVHASTYTTFTRASQYTLRSCTTAAVRVEHRPPRTRSRVHPFTVILSMFKHKLHRRVERGGSPLCKRYYSRQATPTRVQLYTCALLPGARATTKACKGPFAPRATPVKNTDHEKNVYS